MSMLAIAALSGITLVWLWMKIEKHGMQLIAVLLVVAAFLGFFFIHTFQVFSSRTKAATVRCSAASNVPHTMLVGLTVDGSAKTYQLAGDRWMLQSSVVEFQDWTKFLGVKSGFQLDRLDSEFNDPNHATAKPISLGGNPFYKTSDAWMYFPLIKSAYGNAVIQNCDGRNYDVFLDVNGDMSARRA